MKCNIFLTVASVLIAALIGYGFYAANSSESFVWLLCSGAGITSVLTLTGIFGISTKGRTGGINITALSSIFFVLFLICNLVFAFTAVKLAPYVIINGILLLIYAIGIYGIVKSKH